MGRPKNEGEQKQLAVWVRQELDRKLAERAKAEGKTKRDVVTAALSAYVGRGKVVAEDEDMPGEP